MPGSVAASSVALSVWAQGEMGRREAKSTPTRLVGISVGPGVASFLSVAVAAVYAYDDRNDKVKVS